MDSKFPPFHQALVLRSVEKDLSGINIEKVATPIVEAGSALVRILSAGVLSYQRDIYDGSRDYPLPKPLVGGFSAVGRVVALGYDAVALEVGTLVFLDCVIRGRDDVDAMILSGISDGFNEHAQKLMNVVWRDGVFAEFAKFPLESCVPLDESRLCHELGYTVQDLTYLGYLLVSFGGIRDIKLEPGETIAICPATGGFGGAGVQVATAMGARVIAMGRNEGELDRLRNHILSGNPGASIETVTITGNENNDTAALLKFGAIDAVLDFSPAAASKSMHLNSAIKALRRRGRVSLMGGFHDGPLPSFQIIANDITIKGKFMYEREDVAQFIKMLEIGMFPRGDHFVVPKNFSLDDWKPAFNMAAHYTGVGRFVVITP
ncbi:alcohol dehydrogenase [Trichoderma arundinaceum]|uniref:Alcohol dehydrogenase n=1 Tax=Trichoderma arundinaceum TaxID=490622 RepID=A0A395N9B6_TRIAR|nr:alcohol dehydrogenase [Trichoderma arundinaceum]